MNFKSKKILLLILAVTALVLSRILFVFFNDPEGPNLLVVMGIAVTVYLVSLIAYLVKHITNWKRLLFGVFIQILIAIGLYYLMS